MKMTRENVQKKIKKYSIVLPNGCWEWQKYRNRTGYAQTRIDTRNIYVHRASYFAFVEEIPKGLVLDHLCRNRACVNPDHLEPVTDLVNIRRGLEAAGRKLGEPTIQGKCEIEGCAELQSLNGLMKSNRNIRFYRRYCEKHKLIKNRTNNSLD